MGASASNGLTGIQCRMARSGLRWTVDELARRAKVGRVTITRLENDLVRANPATLAAIRRAFETAGAEFPDDDTVTIRKPGNGKKPSGGASA